MSTLHDPASRSHAGSSVEVPSPFQGSLDPHAVPPETDVLSDVLRAIALSGALFFRVEATSPWAVDVPRAHAFARIILPGAQHVISYHIITTGSGWISVSDGRPQPFSEGDILVIPHGDAYAMRSTIDKGPGLTEDDSIDFFRAMAAGKLPFIVREGGGGTNSAMYICGFLGCDVRPFNPLLSALPPLMRIPRASPERGSLLDRLIDLTLDETMPTQIGVQCIHLRLSELLFIEVVRLYLESLGPEQTGWLAGLRDKVISRALSLMHRDPARNWTLQSLAREAGTSRSVLASRFMHLVQCPPMQYLARWRVQIAARRLLDRRIKASTVGRDVGYRSEAAFSRAFKRISGVSPTEWRDSGRF